MNFEDLKDRLRERIASAWSQFEESSTYASLREKFDALSPAAQKATLFGVLAVGILIVSILPWSYYSSSSDSVSAFEARKTLAKDLFRSQREADALRGAIQPISAIELRARAQSKLASLGLAPEQLGEVAPFDNSTTGHASPAIPKAVQQQGFSISLKSLNLRQVVEVGYQLQSIDPSAKMVGMTVAATAANPHYFDAIYKIVSFAMPFEPEPAAPAPSKSSFGKKSGSFGAKPGTKTDSPSKDL